MYKLTFMDGAMPRAHQLKEGETVIGRAPTCDLVITAPLMSRHHAVLRVNDKRVYLRDAGSTYGTTFKGVKITSPEGAYELLVSYRSGDVWAPKCDQTEALAVELQYFLDCILNDRSPINDGAAGLRVVRLLDAAERSLKDRGRLVAL